MWNFRRPSGRWGRPSPVYNPNTREYETGGYIWWGRSPATGEDIERLRKEYGNVKIDERTLVGRDNPAWTTFMKVKRVEWKRKVKL